MGALKSLRRAASYLLQPLVRRAAGRYIAGPELTDALRVVESLRVAGVPTTVGYWDGSEDQPQDVQRQYLESIEAIWRNSLDSYPSIKLPALRDQVAMVEPVLELALTRGVRVHFDSLGAESVTSTLATAARAVAAGAMISCTIPGRFQRSPADAEQATSAGILVRVVKGQWGDPQCPTLDPRAGFMAVVERLAGHAAHVAVATHDAVLGQRAIERLQAAGTSCEWELLYGLSTRAVLKSAARLQVPIRFYIPYGQAYLPYALSAAVRNPRLVGQVLSDACSGWLGRGNSWERELRSVAHWPSAKVGIAPTEPTTSRK